MTDTIKPPLPEDIHKALGRFAQAVAFGDDLQRRIDAGADLEGAIRDYADAAVAQERSRMNEHAATLANTERLIERERCAQIVQTYPHWLGPNGKSEIAAAIRAGEPS